MSMCGGSGDYEGRTNLRLGGVFCEWKITSLFFNKNEGFVFAEEKAVVLFLYLKLIEFFSV